MKQTQKIIKYLALGLAIILIINIFSVIIFGIVGITSIFYPEINNNIDLNYDEIRELNIEKTNINNLELDLAYTSLIIKTSDTFKIETNNKYLEARQKNNTLYIEETKRNWITFKNNSYELIIYLPNDIIFNEVDIDAGAGRIDIEKLNTDKVSFSLGAGKTTINNLNVSRRASIEGGLGEIVINSSNINNLEVDNGLGNFEVNAILIGNIEINSGIGKVSVNLLDSINNYKLLIDKGIGSIKVNNEKINDNIYGNGFNLIEIDNGIGEIEITSIER